MIDTWLKGLDIHKYSGLEVGGLDTLIRAGLQGGAQIIRPSVSHSGQTKYLHIAISTYHQKKGLSSPLKKGGESRKTSSILGSITNPIVGYGGYAANEVCRLKGFGKKGLMVFYLFNDSPRKSMIENQKYKIVKRSSI